MEDDEDIEKDRGGPEYRRAEEIGLSELRDALGRLQLFGDDPYLSMQAFNLALVDQTLTGLEYQVLEKLNKEDTTPIPETAFLSALSQMWIFAAYELMRTWRQRARNMVKWAENGALETKLREFGKDLGHQHFGRQFRAKQIKRVLADASIVGKIKDDLRRTHILFARTAAVRISLAKHEVKGRSNSVALMPGYGRINRWCGSLDFDMENGVYSKGYLSRRDIAEGIRAFATTDPPSDETIKEFDAFMRGPNSAPDWGASAT
jgi:hypothetical protein